MSDGKCGTHTYPNITEAKMMSILDALRKNGAIVTGNNPWDVDTHKYGIKLRGTWDNSTAVLSVIVTDKDFYVPCGKIWSTIDELIGHITSLAEADLPARTAAR